jgi:hypothetical protein
MLLWLQLLPWIYLSLILGGILVLLIFLHPFWGLCTFVFLIPLEEAFLITEKLTFLKIIGLLIFSLDWHIS